MTYRTWLITLLLASQPCWAGDRLIYPMQCHAVRCEHDPKLSTNITCLLQRESPGLAYLSLGGTLLAEAHDILFNFQAYLKKANIYVPTMITGSGDVCEFVKGTRNMFLHKLFPHAAITLKSVLHPCPYKGRILLSGYELRGNVVGKFLPSGIYRFDFVAKNYDNETYFGTKIYCIVNKKLVKNPQL